MQRLSEKPCDVIILSLTLWPQSARKQPLGTENQDHDQQAEREDVFIVRVHHARELGFRHAEDKATEHGAGREPMPPSTAAVKALMPITNPT